MENHISQRMRATQGGGRAALKPAAAGLGPAAGLGRAGQANRLPLGEIQTNVMGPGQNGAVGKATKSQVESKFRWQTRGF